MSWHTHPQGARKSQNQANPRWGARVSRLQAAISALGDCDVAEKESLEQALQKAKSQAVVPPVPDQIASTRSFIERAKKRVAAEEAAVQQALKKRDESLEALVKAEKRLEELELQQQNPSTNSRDNANPEAELARASGRLAGWIRRTPQSETEDRADRSHPRARGWTTDRSSCKKPSVAGITC